MRLYIRNMVCDRCRLVIAGVLEQLGLTPRSLLLGEVDFGDETLSADQLQALGQAIEPLGFELVDGKRGRLIERIKHLIIDRVREEHTPERGKLSDYLSERLHYDYQHLSHLFSSVEGLTIEQYLIRQKVERVKELLVYDELTLTEIAHRLGYSSVAHLSNQFKKVTGLAPSHFKQARGARWRVALDKIK